MRRPGRVASAAGALLLLALAPGARGQSGFGGGVQGYGGAVTGLRTTETAAEVRMELAADVLFDFDRAEILPKAAEALHQVASVIRQKARGPVRVEGHTDAKGTAEYNQRLSVQRAEAVKAWFVEHEGLGKTRFVTHGFGAEKPVAPNTRPDGSDDPEGRQKNRRVEVVVRKR